LDVGIIPAGMLDLRVTLSAFADVDIQLYDRDATSNFGEGQAIVAFCAGEDCNRGILGSSSSQETARYEGRSYTYSGFEGGNEWVEVDGLTNRNLMMKAYGYGRGKALVEYSYWRNPSLRGDRR
jgi:hypothetical protein